MSTCDLLTPEWATRVARTPKVVRPIPLDDVYRHADLVTYPSLYEGFGNAFLEAVYFRKPIVVKRYSIFITDIEPKGFQIIPSTSFPPAMFWNKSGESLTMPTIGTRWWSTTTNWRRLFSVIPCSVASCGHCSPMSPAPVNRNGHAGGPRRTREE